MEEAGGNLRLKSGVKYVDLAFDYRFFLAAQAQQNFAYSRKQLVGSSKIRTEPSYIIIDQPAARPVISPFFIFYFNVFHCFCYNTRILAQVLIEWQYTEDSEFNYKRYLRNLSWICMS